VLVKKQWPSFGTRGSLIKVEANTERELLSVLDLPVQSKFDSRIRENVNEKTKWRWRYEMYVWMDGWEGEWVGGWMGG
jgi:hypothetical protein